jgi:hypothetical protein
MTSKTGSDGTRVSTVLSNEFGTIITANGTSFLGPS